MKSGKDPRLTFWQVLFVAEASLIVGAFRVLNPRLLILILFTCLLLFYKLMQFTHPHYSRAFFSDTWLSTLASCIAFVLFGLSWLAFIVEVVWPMLGK